MTTTVLSHRPSYSLRFAHVGISVLAYLILIIGKSRGVKLPTERQVQIINESGHRVQIFWEHVATGELILQSDPHILNGATFSLNSFVSHKFQLRELPGVKTGVCGDVDDAASYGMCRTNYFTVNENRDQVITITRGLRISHKDDKTQARSSALAAIQECQEHAKDIVQQSNSRTSSQESGVVIAQTYDDLLACVERNVAKKLEQAHEEIAFQASLRQTMEQIVQKFTCADDKRTTSNAMEMSSWNYYAKNYKVHIMLDNLESKIHLIENFISDKECMILEEQAIKVGVKKLAVPRNAMPNVIQINIPTIAEDAGKKKPSTASSSVDALKRRVFDYADNMLDLDVDDEDQEQLAFFTYLPESDNNKIIKNEKEIETNSSTSQCDRNDGVNYRNDNRIATVLMYCGIAEKGGALNFPNAGLHIAPTKNMALFISYVGPDGKMDMGFSEYSECPVLKGGKKVIAQWLRQEVDVDLDKRWESRISLDMEL